MPGADAPESRVCRDSGREHTRSQVTPKSPGIPRAMVYGLYVLSPVIGLLTPSLAEKCRQLDASVEASGPHDFAVREARAFVSSAARVHRIPPHGCDVRETPL
jgi:hypothetical protein